jgi:hypothetical protein
MGLIAIPHTTVDHWQALIVSTESIERVEEPDEGYVAE